MQLLCSHISFSVLKTLACFKWISKDIIQVKLCNEQTNTWEIYVVKKLRFKKLRLNDRKRMYIAFFKNFFSFNLNLDKV